MGDTECGFDKETQAKMWELCQRQEQSRMELKAEVQRLEETVAARERLLDLRLDGHQSVIRVIVAKCDALAEALEDLPPWASTPLVKPKVYIEGQRALAAWNEGRDRWLNY